MLKTLCCHLEVKDAGVAVPKALALGDDAVEEAFVQRERGDGRQQPAVPCRDTHEGDGQVSGQPSISIISLSLPLC